MEFRVACNLRSALGRVLKLVGASKDQKTEELVGCSWVKLVKHLESLFADGMEWDNYGSSEENWSIDHIRPCASFDLTDVNQQKECFHYSNLQPLWNKDNWVKNSWHQGEYVRRKRN